MAKGFWSSLNINDDESLGAGPPYFVSGGRKLPVKVEKEYTATESRLKGKAVADVKSLANKFTDGTPAPYSVGYRFTVEKSKIVK